MNKIKLAIADIDGVLRGKYINIKKFNKLKKNNNLYAAVYLDTLWNQMTYYQDFVKSKYLKNEFNSKKNIICLDMNIINKQINKLTEWFLSPTATYTNYD